MAYEKHTWQCGETVTAELLNHLEDGIAEGGGGSNEFFSFEIVDDGSDTIASKSYSEIKAAIASGLLPIAHFYSVYDGDKHPTGVAHITRGYEYGDDASEYHFGNVYLFPDMDVSESESMLITETGYVINDHNEVNSYGYTAKANAY